MFSGNQVLKCATGGLSTQYCVFKPIISRTKGGPEPLGLNFKSGDMTVSPLEREGKGGIFYPWC